MKIYVKRPVIKGAWVWIQKAYHSAWNAAGLEAEFFDNFADIEDEEFDLMIREWDLKGAADIEVVKRSRRSYMFALTNTFPMPWGAHPNYNSQLPDEIIRRLNAVDNLHLWSFGDDMSNHGKWKKVNPLHLAFDSEAYIDAKDEKYAYDICYIGGRANNGFDEKYPIMKEYFGKFRHDDLKVGIFIDKNLSHELENKILCSSKVCLNIHDKYQRVLVTTDGNERTFKSLGCNGLMVSDVEGLLPKFFPDLPVAQSAQEMYDLTHHYLKLPESELNIIRKKYREEVNAKHTYINRVHEAIEFTND